MTKIGMFGAGYVGLVTGACFADLGHDVVIRDVIPERIERLRAGEVPIYEPGLELVLERNRDRIQFTLDIDEAVDGADFLYVAVGTPPTESGDADLTAVWSVIDEPTGRIIMELDNPMRDPGDGSVITATNISIITYAGDGLWRQQEDIYNPLRFVQAALKWCRKAQKLGTLDEEAARFMEQYGGTK